MAVVTRTWALRWRGRHRWQGFDFCSLTHCQVFRLPSPSRSEFPRALPEAVQKTEGKILKYHDQLVDPYFSANCGGVTEAAGAIWPDRAQPYLPVATDPYCAGSEHSSWQRKLSLETVETILNEDLLGWAVDGPLRDLKIEEKDASGRVRILRAVSGLNPRIDANEFRYALNRRLGWNTLEGNLYSLQRQDDALVFVGRGLGHGVGLCQAGAEQMGWASPTKESSPPISQAQPLSSLWRRPSIPHFRANTLYSLFRSASNRGSTKPCKRSKLSAENLEAEPTPFRGGSVCRPGDQPRNLFVPQANGVGRRPAPMAKALPFTPKMVSASLHLGGPASHQSPPGRSAPSAHPDETRDCGCTPLGRPSTGSETRGVAGLPNPTRNRDTRYRSNAHRLGSRAL